MVPALVELTHELNILLDGPHRAQVAGLIGRRHEHIVEGEAEAALW